MSRPDCFIAGFYKCGTTSLYMILEQNTDILVSGDKENFFFGDITLFKKGISWYEKCYYNFEKETKEEKIVEINPGLSQIKGTALRLRKYYPPETPIIFIMRNPVDFIYSHYRFEMRRGAFPLKEMWYCRKKGYADSFDWYIRNKKTELKKYQHFFSRQIKEYQKYFTNIKFLFLEDVYNNPQEIYREITEFFEVKYDENVNVNIKANVTDFMPKYIVVKKIHLWLKYYNRRNRFKTKNAFQEVVFNVTTVLENVLIDFVENHKIEDTGKMHERTKRQLQTFFESEKNLLEQLTQKELKKIWW